MNRWKVKTIFHWGQSSDSEIWNAPTKTRLQKRAHVVAGGHLRQVLEALAGPPDRERAVLLVGVRRVAQIPGETVHGVDGGAGDAAAREQDAVELLCLRASVRCGVRRPIYSTGERRTATAARELRARGKKTRRRDPRKGKVARSLACPKSSAISSTSVRFQGSTTALAPPLSSHLW